MGEGDRVAVIIPWRPGCPHREAALGWVVDRWEQTGHTVTLGGQQDDGPWRKASAVAHALDRTDTEVLVIADADVWCPTWSTAVDAVTTGSRPWAMPHAWVRRLSQDATTQVLSGREPLTTMPHAERPHRGMPGGGMVVLTRDLYDQVPLDGRFAGWGQEDESWARALAVIAGRGGRGRGMPWHLWHPPQERDSRRWGSKDSKALASRYRAARTPEAMRDLLSEAA